MHPAVSVIFFTVSSGAGLGLMALIGFGAPMPTSTVGIVLAGALSIGLSAAGLISSTYHLGHPERAFRAFSQWRSSWLSREGVAAVITLLLFGFYMLFWLLTGKRIEWLGLLSALGAVATVFTTSMIYAQLRTVPAWNTALTPLCYLAFSAASGLVLAAALGPDATGALPYTVPIALIFAAMVKAMWFYGLDTCERRPGRSTPESATGLGHLGDVRLLEKPHSGESYLTREMVHRIGRKHARKLRVMAALLGVVAPVLIALLILGTGSPAAWFMVAFVLLSCGLFVERWLFFAEAKHVVSLYY